MPDNATKARKRLNEHQHELSKEQASHRAGLEVAAAKEREKVENPDFLGKLQEADLDTDLWDWVEDELGPLQSGARIIGNRGEHYEEYAELGAQNSIERVIAERQPGRLLRENPRMLAIAQGITGTKEKPDPTDNPEFRTPLTSRKKRVLRDVADVLASRDSLSIDGRGLDAVSTVTVENKSVTEESEEASGAIERAKGVFR